MNPDRKELTGRILATCQAKPKGRWTIKELAETLQEEQEEVQPCIWNLVHQKKLRTIRPGRARNPGIYGLWRPPIPYNPVRSQKESAWLKLREEMNLGPIPDPLQKFSLPRREQRA